MERAEILTLEQAVKQVKAEREGNRDVLVRDPDQFHVGVGEFVGGKPSYALSLNGTTAPLASEGIKSLCRMLGMDLGYFKDYPDPGEFVEHVRTLVPGHIRKTGVLVRLAKDGSVRGVVPGDYTVLDDDQILEILGNVAYQTLDKVGRVAISSSKWGGSLYRLIFGESALTRDEIYPCLNLQNSEIGGTLSVNFGTFRLACTNGSIDTSRNVGSILNWGHKGNFDRAVNRIGLALRNADADGFGEGAEDGTEESPG